MHVAIRFSAWLPGVALATMLPSVSLQAAPPKVGHALKLAPIQKDVQYDRPSAADASKCTISIAREGKATGWVVSSPQGDVLRRFMDMNGDNHVDQWSYFNDGFEVYRDIDANFNGKADQYRWFHTGGTRWGVDKNEDGKIDQWRMISAEEVAAEVVSALRTRDSSRFSALLFPTSEIPSLGLGSEQAQQLAAKVKAAASKFRTLAARQKIVTKQSDFVNFGATRPGAVPAGTQGSKQDLIVYENASALIETQGKHAQVHLGTMIRSGDRWRLIDAPQLDSKDGIAASGFFFGNQAQTRRSHQPTAATSGPSEQVQKMMAELEILDEQILKTSSSSQKQALNAKRASLLEKLASGSTKFQDRQMWIRQLADTVSATAQAGTLSDGVKRLQALEAKLKKTPTDKPLVAYVTYRRLAAAYGQSLQNPKADFAKIQEQWLKDLKAYVKTYPKSSDAAEAMLQLAIAQEFAGEDESSKKWYSRIVSEHPKSSPAKKAAGAKRRLECVGKSIQLRGSSATGSIVDLKKYRGKTVLIQYWASWCEPCKVDMERLRELKTKYAKRGFAIVGVNLDNDRKQMVDVIRKERLSWPQIHESGGLDNRLANEMGILTLPTMILVDTRGRVVSRNIHVPELESELRKLK